MISIEMASIREYSLKDLSTIGEWKGSTLEEPESDLMIGMVSMPLQESTEILENKRYYVSDTDMIERRFLKTATEEFEKDGDPFGESILHKSLYDCVAHALGIDELVQKKTQEKFMKGELSTGITFREIVSEIARKGYKIPKIVDQKLQDIQMITIVSNAANVPIVVENTDTFTNTNVVWDADLQIVYVRKVVDGWLSVKGTYDELKKMNVIMEPMEKPRNINSTAKDVCGYKITIRKKVNEILEEVKRIGIPMIGEKKKNELVNLYCKHIVFPERFLSMIEYKN
jgi:hypothetical protein